MPDFPLTRIAAAIELHLHRTYGTLLTSSFPQRPFCNTQILLSKIHANI